MIGSNCKIIQYMGENESLGVTGQGTTLEDLVGSLLGCRTVQDVHIVTRRICRHYGYDFFSIFTCDTNRQTSTMLRVVDYASDFSLHYQSQKQMYSDPGIRLSAQNVAPYRIFQSNKTLNLTQKEKKIIDQLSGFGLTEVNYMPVHGADGAFGATRFIRLGGSSKPEPLSMQAEIDLVLLSNYIYTVLARISSEQNALLPEKDQVLCPREREVLLRLASGLTPTRVADLLKISEHTVRNHLSAIRKKLGVRNITHAVAIAISCKMIQW